MAQLEIVQFGHPVLRRTGEPVADFDQSLKDLAANMIDTMHGAEGIGLAAQQVNRTQQICVVDLRGTDWVYDYSFNGSKPPIDLIMPLVLVNPSVTPIPGPVTTESEGCLSFPGLHGDIDRPDQIEVRFQDLDGGVHHLTCNGIFSRCIQHEVDHLEGVLFIDRMHRKSLLEIDRELKQLKRETRRKLKKP